MNILNFLLIQTVRVICFANSNFITCTLRINRQFRVLVIYKDVLQFTGAAGVLKIAN